MFSKFSKYFVVTASLFLFLSISNAKDTSYSKTSEQDYFLMTCMIYAYKGTLDLEEFDRSRSFFAENLSLKYEDVVNLSNKAKSAGKSINGSKFVTATCLDMSRQLKKNN